MAVFAFIKTIMSSLVGKSATVDYPKGPKKTFEATRGHIENDIEHCIFCGICQNKCPTGAILLNKEEKTWSIAQYDCMLCGRCAELCPKKCLRMDRTPPEAVREQVYHTVKHEDTVNPEDQQNSEGEENARISPNA